MALFLLVGMADCPYFAQLEKDFHYVSSRVPDMVITKRSFLEISDYQKFKNDQKSIDSKSISSNSHSSSSLPLVLREYQATNGKGRVIGGFSEAREYLEQYYGYSDKMNTSLMQSIAKENHESKTSEVVQKKREIEKMDEQIVTITVFDSVDFQISYYFVPLLIELMERRDGKVLISLNVVYTYEDEKADALKMELEDCAFRSLIKIQTINLEKFNVSTLSNSQYMFCFDNLDLIGPESEFKKDALLIVHQLGSTNQNKNMSIDDLNLTVKTVSTAAFSYENIVRALLAKKLTGDHAGNNALKVRSVQVSGISVYGRLDTVGGWQIDFKNCQIEDLNESAITGFSGYHRSLDDILIDKSYIQGEIQKQVEKRINSVPTQKRLVSESEAVIRGLVAVLEKKGGHFVTSGRMALPHDSEVNCLGLEAVKNEDLKSQILESATTPATTETE